MGEFHKLNLYSNKYLEFESYFVVSTLFYSCLDKRIPFELITKPNNWNGYLIPDFFRLKWILFCVNYYMCSYTRICRC